MRAARIFIGLGVAAALGGTALSCRRPGFSGDPSVIWDTGSFTVYCDSIVSSYTTNGSSMTAFVTRADSAFAAGLRPSYHSNQRLIDRLYLGSLSRCYHLLRADSVGPMETAQAALSGLALVAPQHMKEALRAQTEKGRVRRPDDWPLTTGHEIWAVAAWETYLATGDREWLDESRETLRRTLDEDLPVCLDDSLGLVRGMTTVSRNDCPEWMNAVDRSRVLTLGSSVAVASAQRILSLMDAEAGVKEPGPVSRNDVTCEVNDRLWIPEMGRYGQYLYGEPYPVVSHTADNRSQALAVVTGVATTDMSESVVSRTACQPEGVARLMPTVAGRIPEYSASTQGLWTLAALRARNGAALRASLGAQIYMSAAKADTASLGEMSTGIATVLRVVAGISLSPSGMRFEPLIPMQLSGTKRITGLSYRGATIDITVEGTGDAISVFKLDGHVASDHCVPADIARGHHTVEITMNGVETDNGEINFTQAETMPPTPTLTWHTPLTGSVSNAGADIEFMTYVDGVFDTQLIDKTIRLFDTRGFTAFTLEPVRDESTWGYGPRPYWFTPAGSIRELPATALGAPLPKPERVRIKRRWVTRTPAPPRFVESAPHDHPVIRTAVTAQHAGTYLIDVSYANGARRPALRSVTVNGHDYGPLVMPSTGSPGRSMRSNTVRVNLIEGLNHIELRLTPDVSCGAVSIESLRLIRT